MFLSKILWFFGLFSGDRGDYIDVWMIKFTIQTNKINMDVCFFKRQINIHKPRLSLKSGFFTLVYWFMSLTLIDKHGTKNL